MPTGTIDLKAEFEQHEFNVGPNEAIESTVTFSRLDNDDPTGEAVDAFVSLVHRTSGEWPVALTPINPEDALVKDDADQWTTKFKPGESKTYKYTVTSQTRDTEVVASIGQTLADKNEADNVDTALIHVKAPNLKVAGFYPGTENLRSGNSYTGFVIYENESDVELKDLEVQTQINGSVVKLWDPDKKETREGTPSSSERQNYKIRTFTEREGRHTVEYYDRWPYCSQITMAANSQKKLCFDWTYSGGGDAVIMAMIDTPPLNNKIIETTEEDNKVTINITGPPAPWTPEPGSVTWKVVSQDGSIVRPFPTAKWTDIIHMEFNILKHKYFQLYETES